MRFSALRSIIIRGKDGRKRWLEVSQLTFPKTANKFDFGQRGYLGMFVAVMAGSYVVIQSVINPDSIYGRTISKILKKFRDGCSRTSYEVLRARQMVPFSLFMFVWCDC